MERGHIDNGSNGHNAAVNNQKRYVPPHLRRPADAEPPAPPRNGSAYEDRGGYNRDEGYRGGGG